MIRHDWSALQFQNALKNISFQWRKTHPYHNQETASAWWQNKSSSSWCTEQTHFKSRGRNKEDGFVALNTINSACRNIKLPKRRVLLRARQESHRLARLFSCQNRGHEDFQKVGRNVPADDSLAYFLLQRPLKRGAGELARRSAHNQNKIK